MITTEQVLAASRSGLDRLLIPAQAIVTASARELSERLGVRLANQASPRRLPWIGGNWKMNMMPADVSRFISSFRAPAGRVEVALFPPAVYLGRLAAEFGSTGIAVGAQSIHHESSGAFTGEISAGMVAAVGGRMALAGHSERRELFGETDEATRLKVMAAVDAGLTAVLCVGESLRDREGGRLFARIRGQLRAGLVAATPPERLVIAYEPIWAIGTGRRAAAEDVRQAHQLIRGELSGMYGESGERIRVVYGGSVSPDNCESLASVAEVDGFLVGGASLKSESLMNIIATTLSVKSSAGGKS